MRTGRPRKYIINIGDVVGDYTCIDLQKDKNNYTIAVMKCNVCGREKIVIPSTFIKAKHGITHKSCGQYLKTKDKRFYGIWQQMRSRTINSNYEHWDCYGGRGINSDCWKYFIDFYDDMYESYKVACDKIGESKTSLERIDVNGDYCEENCCWISIYDQKGNQRKTVYFEIEYPDGSVKYFKNVSLFCRNNNYNISVIRDLINGRLQQAYGLTARRITKEEFEHIKKCND